MRKSKKDARDVSKNAKDVSKDARDVSVNFRVSKYERALIDSLAQRLNKSVSDLMRDLLTENHVLPDRRWNLQELLNE